MDNNDLRTPEVRAVLKRKPQYLVKWGTIFVIVFFIIGCIISQNIVVSSKDTFPVKYLGDERSLTETKYWQPTFIINTNKKSLVIGDKVVLNVGSKDGKVYDKAVGNISYIDLQNDYIRKATVNLNLKSGTSPDFLAKKIKGSSILTLEVIRPSKSIFELFWQNI